MGKALEKRVYFWPGRVDGVGPVTWFATTDKNGAESCPEARGYRLLEEYRCKGYTPVAGKKPRIDSGYIRKG